MTDAVQVERRGAIACVRMMLEHKRNVLTEPLYTSLGQALDELQNQRDVRAIVLSGGRHFCAGGDLNALDAARVDFGGRRP